MNAKPQQVVVSCLCVICFVSAAAMAANVVVTDPSLTTSNQIGSSTATAPNSISEAAIEGTGGQVGPRVPLTRHLTSEGFWFGSL